MVAGLTACVVPYCDPSVPDSPECRQLKEAQRKQEEELKEAARRQIDEWANEAARAAEAEARRAAEDARENFQRWLAGRVQDIQDRLSGRSGQDSPQPSPLNVSAERYACSGAVFQFPMVNGNLGWLYADKRSNGKDPSGDHTGLDIYPPVQDAKADVYPLANGVLKEVNRARHSFEVYYPDQGVTSYMAHVDLNDNLKNDDAVRRDRPLGILLLQPGNTHLHFSLKHTGGWSHYNDQLPIAQAGAADDPSDWFNANLRDAEGTSTPLYDEYPYYRRPYSDFCR